MTASKRACDSVRTPTAYEAGIATNFVIEGTARHAVDEGYQVVVLTDCCASFNDQMHTFSLQILSQLGTAGTAEEFVTALS